MASTQSPPRAQPLPPRASNNITSKSPSFMSKEAPSQDTDSSSIRRGPVPSAQYAVKPVSALAQSALASARPATAPPKEQNNVKFATPEMDSDAALASREQARSLAARGVGPALTDTPEPTAPSSPRLVPARQSSAASTPRIRPTTLDIPGLTKSKVSPDGKIAQRDVGSKLVIVMVGLPARGKSYITKKLARYLNWLQHDTKIFNVGERRRVAASSRGSGQDVSHLSGAEPERVAAEILMNGPPTPGSALMPGIPVLNLPAAANPSIRINGVAGVPPSPRPESTSSKSRGPSEGSGEADEEGMDQSANFFDPSNRRAAALREKAAADTLDDLLDYILNKGGSVGIFDATNSTLQRRKWVMQRIRNKAPAVNVLFIESVCHNQAILESNMRLKLSGPDYKNMDPYKALADFKQRVAIYQKNYIELGDYEEEHNMAYCKVVDVGRKVISHQLNGFLSQQAVNYLQIFNLAPRQIWITRHGESVDNVLGCIGGDSDLTDEGRKYGEALLKFMDTERKVWEVKQRDKAANTHFPPHPGDHTPPNPHFSSLMGSDNLPTKNFCVWTSMLKRSIQTGEPFERDEEDYEVKQMRMLNELYAGRMEGMTYAEIRAKHAGEFEMRQKDKLQYRYPGPGGEGYLDVINRLRPVIVELERMTDHCLLITHRSVARVLLAYFMGLKRDDTADLDCPLGMLYMLEPKPYGVEFRTYKYNAEAGTFEEQPEFKLQRSKTLY